MKTETYLTFHNTAMYVRNKRNKVRLPSGEAPSLKKGTIQE